MAVILIDGWNKKTFDESLMITGDKDIPFVFSQIFENEHAIIVSGGVYFIIANFNTFGNQERIRCSDSFAELISETMEGRNRRSILLEVSEILYRAQMFVTEKIISKSK